MKNEYFLNQSKKVYFAFGDSFCLPNKITFYLVNHIEAGYTAAPVACGRVGTITNISFQQP